MLCENCGKREATVHYTEIVNNQMSEMHLCEECARGKGALGKPHFSLSDLLAGLADTGVAVELLGKGAGKCPSCEMTYEEFRRVGQMGCSDCYDAFEKSLEPLLKRVHGSTRHLGKRCLVGEEEEKPDLRSLRQQLKAAIESENFEEAARLRDCIQELERKQRSKKGKKPEAS